MDYQSNFSPRFAQLRIKHLTLLDQISSGGSLRRAAHSLSVTQPAVTAMLRELEEVFGATLVERDSNGARLTAEGLALQERLRVAQNTLGLTLSKPGVAPRRHLNVGALALSMINLMPEALSKLRRGGSDITFSFSEGTVRQIADGVLDGSLDCAIGRLEAEIAGRMQAELDLTELGSVPLEVVSGRRHPLTRHKRVTLKDLLAYPWILAPARSRGRGAFEQAFLQSGLPVPPPAIESISFFANFHLVARSDLLTIATAAAVRPYEKLGIVTRLPIRWPISLPPLMFLRRKASMESPTIELLRDAVVASKAAMGLQEPRRAPRSPIGPER